MNVPSSIFDLIERWGTIVEFAADVGCGYEAARKMRDRNSIAPEHWERVIAACAARRIEGITYEWLAKRRKGFTDFVPPSGLPAISPTGGEISSFGAEPAE